VDEKTVKKLYQASQAGVKITILCRGICVLIPGIKGVSENITVTGIVDRFLEHSRIMVFANGGEPKYYISSADWMIRNFDHRFEVACPVYDKEIQKELMYMLQTQINDNVKSRYINGKKMNEYKKPAKGEKPIRSQFVLYDYFKKLERKQ
jgi:polyphosphate kinase